MALLQIDLKSAFNLIPRAPFIRETRMGFPKMFRWVKYCYGQNAKPHLWVGDRRFLSFCRVQHGDPLGPMLLALAMQLILVDLNNKMKEWTREHESHGGNNNSPEILVFYLDDGIIT